MKYDRDKLIQELKRDEGYRNRPYFDSLGVLTIGIGHAMGSKPATKGMQQAMYSEGIMDRAWPEEVLEHLFEIDCDEHEKHLGGLAKKKGVDLDRLSDAQVRALINMTFNMGPGRLGRFRNMWAALARDDWMEAAVQALDSRWAKQVGIRSERIAEMLREGV